MYREKVVTVKKLDRKYFEIEHKTGLKIAVFPVEDYFTSIAVLGTKYGSVNNCFINEKAEKIKTPQGIAHFLEHKMFENEDGVHAFTLFSKTGAQANAFTSFNETGYFFLSTNDKFEESLKILLSFVMQPYFTKENIEKEQKIIAQEIKMYDDDPDFQSKFNALSAMYKKHSVGNNIAGSIDSIVKITPELLYTCYNNFYALDNMLLTIVGNLEKEQIIKLVDNVCDTLKKNTNQKRKTRAYYEEEPYEIERTKVSKILPVITPLVTIGFKEKSFDLQENFKRHLIYLIALDILFGDTSDFYKKNYTEGLITDSLKTENIYGEGYFTLLISSETKDPDKLYDNIKAEIKNKRAQDINKEDFELCKKSLISQYIKATENLDDFALILLETLEIGIDLNFVLDFIENIKFEEVVKIINDGFNLERSILSVVSSK